jgi:hypothetical protein
VNTHTQYRRHSYRPPEFPVSAAGPSIEAAASALARHRDPSLTAVTKSPTTPAKGIAWVRPTELATYVAPMVGRGVDLHAELTRRALRAPATTTRALQRRGPQPAAPVPPATGPEGLSL